MPGKAVIPLRTVIPNLFRDKARGHASSGDLHPSLRPLSRNKFGMTMLACLALAGCDDMSVGNRTARSGEVKVAMPDDGEANASRPLEGVGAPVAWRVVNGAAFYGAASQPPAFALRCDPAAKQIVFERAGGGASLILSAGGLGASLGTRDLGNGRVQARTGLGDAVLDAMARSQAQIVVGGGAEPLTVPGGVAIRRVLDDCRNPPAPTPTQGLSLTPEEVPGGLVIPKTIDEPAPEPLPSPGVRK
jgi:hypothetical protein